MIRSLFCIFTVLFLVAPSFALDQRRLGESQIGIAVPYALAELEPLAVNEPVARLVFASIAQGLLKRSGADLLLDTAASYQNDDEQKRWEVVLPREVFFSDGAAFRAESVVTLYQFYQQRAKRLLAVAALPTGVPRSLLMQLENIEKISSQTRLVGEVRPIEEEVVIFDLKASDASFRDVLTLPLLDMRVVGLFDQQALQGTNVAALGPFNLAASNPGQGYTLRSVEHYFRSGFPQLKTVELRQLVDAEQALSALRVGSIDIILTPTAKMLEHVEKDPTLISLPSPLKNISYQRLAWQLRQPFWSEEKKADDVLLTDKIVVRKSLLLDDAALQRLDLSSVYVP